MTPTIDPAISDARLAAALAQAAGRLLLELRSATSGVDGDAGKALGAAGDAAANRLLIDALRLHRPDDAILSEESADDGVRLSHRRVWIVDPLDGTREYAEGRSDWAVHVALAIDGAPVVGAVALPVRDLVLASDAVTPVAAPRSPPRIVVSRTRPPAEAQALAVTLGSTLLPMGSAGAKVMAVILGEADAYVHSGGQYEWDSCAPVAVALAHGLHCSRIDGTPLTYNHANVSLPDLLVCHPGDAARLLSGIAAA